MKVVVYAEILVILVSGIFRSVISLIREGPNCPKRKKRKMIHKTAYARGSTVAVLYCPLEAINILLHLFPLAPHSKYGI